MMKKIHWINPKFVAEIKFAEWTRDGKLRAPVFLGLRDDKNRAKLFAKRHLLDSARGAVRPDAFLEAERQSVRAFSLAYSNIKSREN
jgi:ATP-dependent DNA ligase